MSLITTSDIRDQFTLTLDSIMKKIYITEDKDCNKDRNIFDELAAKIGNDMEK